MAKSNQKLNEDRIRLLKIIREKKDEVIGLEQKISNIEEFRTEKKSLETEIIQFKKEKEKIQSFINDNNQVETLLSEKKYNLMI